MNGFLVNLDLIQNSHWSASNINENVSRKTQYNDVYTRTIEILQRPHICKANCCLKVHNAHLKLAQPISEYGFTFVFAIAQ